MLYYRLFAIQFQFQIQSVVWMENGLIGCLPLQFYIENPFTISVVILIVEYHLAAFHLFSFRQIKQREHQNSNHDAKSVAFDPESGIGLRQL